MSNHHADDVTSALATSSPSPSSSSLPTHTQASLPSSSPFFQQTLQSPPPPPSSSLTEQRMSVLENKFDMMMNSLSDLQTLVQLNITQSAAARVNNTNIYKQHGRAPTPAASHVAIPSQAAFHTTTSPASVSSSSSSSSSTRPYGGLVKFNPPSTFTGKPPVDAITVLNFVSKMGFYLTAVQIDHDSNDSLAVSLMSLGDFALLWYEQTMKSDPHAITCWNDLKEQLVKKYRPAAQEQASFDILSEINYKGSVANYIHEFETNLRLVPDLNTPETQKILMNIFVNRMSKSNGTHFICTTMRTAMSANTVSTLTELESVALIAEGNLGHKGTRVPPATVYIPPNRQQQQSRFGHNQSFRSKSSASASASGQFNRTPIRNPTFPSATVANVNSLNQQHYDEQNEQLYDPGVEYENEFNDDTNATATHEDSSHAATHDSQSNSNTNQSGTNENESMSLFLNQLKVYDKNVRRNPSLTPDEFDRRRRNNTCFRCNKEGHYANACPLPPHSKKF